MNAIHRQTRPAAKQHSLRFKKPSVALAPGTEAMLRYAAGPLWAVYDNGQLIGYVAKLTEGQKGEMRRGLGGQWVSERHATDPAWILFDPEQNRVFPTGYVDPEPDTPIYLHTGRSDPTIYGHNRESACRLLIRLAEERA